MGACWAHVRQEIDVSYYGGIDSQVGMNREGVHVRATPAALA